MSTQRTVAAIHAIEQLSQVGFLNSVLRGRMYDPAPEGSEYHPNWKIFRSVEWYLTCREITHAADVLNAYLQSLLAEALEHSPELWGGVEKRFPKDWTCEKAIEKLRVQRASDGQIRQIFGRDMTTFWNAEMDLIALIRNKIVHQGGYDPEGSVPKAIEKCRNGRSVLPPIEHLNREIPIGVDDAGRLQIDAEAGKWATDHVLHNVWMMDQNWMAHFDIPGQRHVLKGPSFTWHGRQRPGFFGPGQPLPTHGPEPRPKIEYELPEFPTLSDMIDEKEIECARTWKKIRSDIHSFVEEYCDEIGARVVEFRPSIPGRFPPQTIGDHEHHIGYKISDEDAEDRGGWIGIRMRQRECIPYLTIWSEKVMMRDYEPCEMSAEVEEVLRDCIEGALKP